MTVPEKASLDIASHYNVSDIWLAPRASVQTLADRVNRYGTRIGSGENGIWVGSPLRIHRRCDDPMFSISNAIAYDGLMISDVKRESDPQSDIFSTLRCQEELVAESYWADRPATIDGNHLQPDEINAFNGALDYLKKREIPDSEILAISPFKTVAEALEKATKHRPELKAGTIHVAQGRQADVVILVLGGAKDRPGAKAWASHNPNLLNVAVSRAKRRLYVIGDHGLWKGMSHFDRAARDLPRRSAPSARTTSS
ncbi:MAG: AAA domain-containing protein [Brevibacterium sp.]|nr:AAA domain-containing protein [Brevibacterium sp.]